jgi:acyl-CoA synthetase (NDP forming)/RimJ/RimL family protein N-acetyltransferase
VAEDLPPDYPAQWETHAVLNDGALVELRPIRPADRDLIDAFHKRQSPESIYFRFFRYRPELSANELDYFTQVDYRDRMAFVGLLGGELVAVARYERLTDRDVAEVAFFVDDGHHGRGLATLLLEYLAAAARGRGLTGFTATVLPENYRMLGVFRRAGFDVSTRFDDGVIEVELDISVTAETSSAIASRQSRARTQSVARLLRPGSVAVVGASRRPGSVGHELLRNIRRGGFTGEVYAVNRAASEVQGQPSWPSLASIGKPVDLAVVAVPAGGVDEVVADAAEAKVGGLLVVSSGFSDAGPAGVDRERSLVVAARRNGMRVIGPNAFGLVNTAPDVQLRALFLPIAPERGSVALLSQSGPLGGAVLEQMKAAHVGISSFVSVGNRADVSVNDLLDYWSVDDETDAVLLYVENYGNLRNAAATARAISARKPVVAVRPGDDNLVELLAQSGVILVDGVSELAELARVAASQPLPRGRRVAVVSNAASVARLAVTACRRHGLEVVVPSSVERYRSNLASAADAVLLADAETTPGDGGGTVAPDYEQILVAASVSDEVDAVLIAIVPTLDLSLPALCTLLDQVNRSISKPVVATGLVGQERLPVPGLPRFTFPEEAARSLGRLAAYSEWRQASPGGVAVLPDDPAELGLDPRLRPELVDLLGGAGAARLSLSSAGARRAFDALQIPVAPWRVGSSLGELVAGASDLGFPVVLKVAGSGIRTVGEAGGAAIDLHDAAQLEAAFARMLAARGGAMLPAVVQKMVDSTGMVKIELIQDPELGAFVRVGLGGTTGLRLPPLARRFLPLAATDEALLVDAITSTVGVDAGALAVIRRVVARLGLLGAAIPELSQLCCDPILLCGAGTVAVDVAITLRPWDDDPLAEVRRL